MIHSSPGATYEAAVVNLAPSLPAGTVGVAVKDRPAGGVTTQARTTAGIVEEPAGSGQYGKSDLLAPTTAGTYWLHWDSGPSTAPFAVEELVVGWSLPTPGPTGPVTLAELRAYSGVTKPEREPLLQGALDAAHAHVRGIPRQIDPLPATSGDPAVTVRRRTNGRRLVRVPDARQVTEVRLDGTATTDYELRTCRAPTSVYVELTGDPTTVRAVKVVEVVGRFGMDPIPADLRQAILALALRRYRERELGEGPARSEEYGLRPLPPFPGHTFAAYKADVGFLS